MGYGCNVLDFWFDGYCLMVENWYCGLGLVFVLRVGDFYFLIVRLWLV